MSDTREEITEEQVRERARVQGLVLDPAQVRGALEGARRLARQVALLRDLEEKIGAGEPQR